MASKFLIYGLIYPRTKQIRYIGKSSSGLERPKAHTTPSEYKRNISRKNNWVISLLKKGLVPEIIILEELQSESELNEREIYHISQHDNLTNMTSGGTGGNTGGSYKKWKKVIAKEIKTGKEKSYDYVWQTEVDGFSPTKVVAVCKGKRLSHRGFIFRYESGEYPKEISKRQRQIIVIYKNKELKFNSLSAFCDYFNVSTTTAYKFIKGLNSRDLKLVTLIHIDEQIKDRLTFIPKHSSKSNL